jgi:hypothetical protein
VEEVDSLNSFAIIELGLDEIPLILGINSLMLHLPSPKVNPFHVIFNLNEVLIATRF